VWHDISCSHICVILLVHTNICVIYMRDVTRSHTYMKKRVTSRIYIIHICNVIYMYDIYAWRYSFTHIYVWYICVTLRDVILPTRPIILWRLLIIATHIIHIYIYAWRYSFTHIHICVIFLVHSLVHTHDMTQSYVWHDSFIYVWQTAFIHDSFTSK